MTVSLPGQAAPYTAADVAALINAMPGSGLVASDVGGIPDVVVPHVVVPDVVISDIVIPDMSFGRGDPFRLTLLDADEGSTTEVIEPTEAVDAAAVERIDTAFAEELGRTDMLVGYWKHHFTHVPLPLAVSRRKQIDPRGALWSSVLSSTGQPKDLA